MILATLDLTDNRDKQIKDILDLGADNPYCKKLYDIYMFSNSGKLTKIQTDILVNAVIGDYIFDVVMPEEDRQITKQRKQAENDIPDFSNVYVGQQWAGKNRMADFIKSLGLKPKPAGKHSRTAQEKSILRSCAFSDDKDTKIIELLEIYNERKPKFRKEREKKYELLIELRLINKLMQNGILKTTKQNFFRDIGAMPSTYKNVPLDYYYDIIPKDKLSGTDNLGSDLCKFHGIIDERHSDIIDPVLKSLERKLIIKYDKTKIIVTKNDKGKKIFTPLFDDKSFNYAEGTLAKMMMNAEIYAANQIEVTTFDEKKRKKVKIRLKDINDVMKYYKQADFKEYYNKYIKDNYGWDYTYEEIRISLTDNEKHLYEELRQTVEEAKKSMQELNEMIYKADKRTIKTKYDNKEKKYLSEFNRLYQLFLEDSNIHELLEIGTYKQKDLYDKVHEQMRGRKGYYRFPQNFLERTDCFLQHEVLIDKKSQQTLAKWKAAHRKKVE